MPGHARAAASELVAAPRTTRDAYACLRLRRLVRNEVGDGRQLARLRELAHCESLAVQLFLDDSEHVVADAKRGELRSQCDSTDVESHPPGNLRERRHPWRGLQSPATDLERDVPR